MDNKTQEVVLKYCLDRTGIVIEELDNKLVEILDESLKANGVNETLDSLFEEDDGEWYDKIYNPILKNFTNHIVCVLLKNNDIDE